MYPELTPYQFASNSPIINIDLDGLEAYSIHLRRFAPFSWFGGGFKGDGANRGFSTYSDAAAKLSVTTTYDIASNTVSSPLARDVTSVGGFGLWKAISDSKATSGITADGSIFLKAEAGNDAAIPFTDTDFTDYVGGNIDYRAQLDFTQNGDILSIEGTLTGDLFPSGEALVEDESGTVLFLGTNSIPEGINNIVGRQIAPYTMLLGDFGNHLCDVNIEIAVDGDGQFLGVYDQRNDVILSPDAYNQRFETESPVRNGILDQQP